MERKFSESRSAGIILIFALWSLGLLVVLALTMSMGVRQKIIFLKRLEEKSELRAVTSSCVLKAIAVLRANPSKHILHNDEELFADVAVSQGNCEVSYSYPDSGTTMYGLMDEESKLNINTAKLQDLKRIIQYVVRDFGEAEAQDLAEAIIDWRDVGQSQMEGFYSDEFYENLEFPYSVKNAPFELLDELLLVKGMNKDIFRQLTDYLTVYGDGVNLNTASKIVLMSTGLSEDLVNLIITLRAGKDGVVYTQDDYLFSRVISDLHQFRGKEVTEEDMEIIDQLESEGVLLAQSNFFLIRSHGKLAKRDVAADITCVYDTINNQIVYWQDNI